MIFQISILRLKRYKADLRLHEVRIKLSRSVLI